MEVTALTRLLLTALVMQHCSRTSGFRIIPNSLQLFEYKELTFICEGFNVSAGLKVRTIKNIVPNCPNYIDTSRANCTIDYIFVGDSGEYWCESGDGGRSNIVNIIVTDGPVILESPVLPVMEGDNVTLRCINKETSSTPTADFYKNGILIKKGFTGNMVIHNVSKSHEGLYKCRFGAGESPASPLTVTGDVKLESPALPVTEGETVTLRCRNQRNPFYLQADFYKDGNHIDISSTGELIIHSVSKSDEGLYKCISGAGESAVKQLLVKEQTPNHHGSGTKTEKDRRAPQRIPFLNYMYLLFWIAIAVVLILQLLVIGLLYWKKQLVLLEVEMSEQKNKDMYNPSKKGKKQKDTAGACDNLSFCLETNHSTKPHTEKGKIGPTTTADRNTVTVILTVSSKCHFHILRYMCSI
ncbi:low affinity immunoglobulin gamma Fc region receptor II-like isoform X2 [Anabas testudineus]|uniref:low affinity immunoglobulin gamma Fc region receptor II-like isoform X2 n=1 Tax=Anabas testudineus TaxID=64144 RepID=UPI000E4563FE|nr:low affinity immunoglobulin gamma Fc region receptor II-like isoform X2 [Anabas testudineus]